MNNAARSEEVLRRLAMIHEGFIQGNVRLGLDLPTPSALDTRSAALMVVAAAVAIGASAICLQWSASRALAAGASEEEIVEVLLAVAPMTGLSQVVCAVPDLASGLGYDVEAALMELEDR